MKAESWEARLAADSSVGVALGSESAAADNFGAEPTVDWFD